ncbi:YkyA family protein [Bacillus marinisedimentorum]|uniref:YkyA family protein n=1 Tax=Bacillus marinisedimentorum TaxID=1821260 RepID=UPI0007E0EF68|nr:YkyA family protein [Bacillus marinisedimentorum]
MKRNFIAAIAGVSFFLGGCSIGTQPEEEIYQALESAVEQEEQFEKQQEPLSEAEEKEQQLYNEIVGLKMEEFDKISSLSKEAETLAGKRKEMIEKEKESIEASREEFSKVEELAGELEDDQLKKKAAELSSYMNDRYDAYAALYDAYSKAIEHDLELYGMFQDKELKLEELKKHIEEVNKSYDSVMEANKVFNDLTEKYNKSKREFYKMADLDVQLEGQEKEQNASE